MVVWEVEDDEEGVWEGPCEVFYERYWRWVRGVVEVGENRVVVDLTGDEE